jgi:hypothetical protein
MWSIFVAMKFEYNWWGGVLYMLSKIGNFNRMAPIQHNHIWVDVSCLLPQMPNMMTKILIAVYVLLCTTVQNWFLHVVFLFITPKNKQSVYLTDILFALVPYDTQYKVKILKVQTAVRCVVIQCSPISRYFKWTERMWLHSADRFQGKCLLKSYRGRGQTRFHHEDGGSIILWNINIQP